MGQPAFLKDGLVAYYPFNGNANDESGKGGQATFTGIGGEVADRFGGARSARRINKIGDRIIIGNGPSTGKQNTSWSFGLWCNIQTVTGTIGSLLCEHDTYQIDYTYSANLTAFSTGDLDNHIRAGVANSEFSVLAKNSIVFQSWIHAFCVIDASTSSQRIFVNGKLVATGAYDTARDYSSGNKWAIGSTWNSNWGFLGDVDNVRIYNRALSDGEVKSLHDYESTPPDNNFITNGLVAYYPFNGNANDESGNKYTGAEIDLTYTADRFSRNGSSPLFNGVSSVVHLPINNWATPEYSINCWVKGL